MTARAALRPLKHAIGPLRRVGTTARRTARLLTPPRDKVAYVGFVGRANVGDEAIFAAHRRLFPTARFVQPPEGRHARRAITWARRVTGHSLVGGVLLGGGTLIGRFRWHERLASVLDPLPDLPAVMLGVGVEDPSFEDAALLTSRAELRRWVPLLARFERVTVRGPHSQAILEDLGVPAVPIGDPAFVLADDRPSERVEEKLLGLNLAVPEVRWGSAERLLHEIETFARQRLDDGWRIELVILRPGDRRLLDELARRLASPAVTVHDGTSPPPASRGGRGIETLLGLLRRHHVFVGERLHGVALASAVHVPSVMLAYRPKCLDLQASIDRERFAIRTDRCTAERLTALVDELAADRDRQREELRLAVTRRKAALVAEAAAMAASLGIEHADPGWSGTGGQPYGSERLAR